MTASEDRSELERLERAFHELRLLSAASRAARLETLAVDSPELVRELEPLLRAHDGTALVDEPPMADRHPETLDLRTGDVVGGYILESILGTGGMGTVWRARQLRPRRSVALKLVRSVYSAETVHRRVSAGSRHHGHPAAPRNREDLRGGRDRELRRGPSPSSRWS